MGRIPQGGGNLKKQGYSTAISKRSVLYGSKKLRIPHGQRVRETVRLDNRGFWIRLGGLGGQSAGVFLAHEGARFLLTVSLQERNSKWDGNYAAILIGTVKFWGNSTPELALDAAEQYACNRIKYT